MNMSDTPNPGNLASAPENLAKPEDFDARLKRTDELRWLSSRYAPDAVRPLLVAVYLLHQELARSLAVSEPMIGKIRVQWWREAFVEIASGGPVRRHDVTQELARVLASRADLIAPANALIDAFDDVIDDHLQSGGHDPGGAHARRHLATEAALVRLSAQALDPAATHLDALASVGEAHLARMADLPDAAANWTAAIKAARMAPAAHWPAIAHYAPAQDASPLSTRWRVLRAVLFRRL